MRCPQCGHENLHPPAPCPDCGFTGDAARLSRWKFGPDRLTECEK